MMLKKQKEKSFQEKQDHQTWHISNKIGDVSGIVKNCYMIRSVLNFWKLNGKELTLNSLEWEKEEANIGVLFDWFSFNINDDKLVANVIVPEAVYVHGLYPCNEYAVSLPAPLVTPNGITLFNDTIKQLSNELLSS